MPYAFSVKPAKESCWYCDHFLPIDAGQSVEGYCRRSAPCSLDLYGGSQSENILTTKGDILTRNSSALVRLGVGSDNQVLTANATATDGIEWADPMVLMFWQAGYWNSPLAAGGLLHLTRLGTAPGAPASNSLAISHQTGAGSYNSMEVLPFLAPNADGYLIAVQVAWSAVAVGTAAVGAAPFVRLRFYINDGATEILRATIDVPVPSPVFVGTLDNVVADNFQAAFYVLPAPLLAVSNAFGWKIDLGAGTGDEQIHQIRNAWTQVYYKVPIAAFNPVVAMMAKALNGKELPDAGGIVIDGSLQPEAVAGDKEIDETLQPEPEPATSDKVEDPFLGNIDPNLLTSQASLSKWATIRVAPNEWCGDFKPASHTVPAIPPFVYPTPSPT